MPILHLCTSNISPTKEQLDTLVVEWANEIAVNIKDININLIETKIQAGNEYKIIANLYLPSLWNDEDISHIQLSLGRLIIKHLNLTLKDVFIMTSIIQSGNVVENGNTKKW